METSKIIGLDVGNFDTKTQSTTTPSGFEAQNDLPYGATEWLFYNGMYYIPSETRLPYQRDKTQDESCFILSLIGISKEIIYAASQAKNENQRLAEQNSKKQVREIQQEISTVTSIQLGVGLPPAYYSALKNPTIAYYQERFGDGIAYVYNGYQFKYSLKKISCYPQDFVSLITYNPKNRNNSAVGFPHYYGVDIGGWTVDVVTIIGGKPSSQMQSKPLGVLAMYADIIAKVEQTYGITLEVVDIESYLRGARVLLPEDVKKEIDVQVEAWYKKIIRDLTQSGAQLRTRPVVFMGGGASLFKKYIKEDESLILAEIIPNQKVNAAAYATLVRVGQ
jgi:plasmid segregation protein ParM